MKNYLAFLYINKKISLSALNRKYNQNQKIENMMQKIIVSTQKQQKTIAG